MFTNAVKQMGIENDWYAWQSEALMKRAEESLVFYGVDFVDGKIVCNNKDCVRKYLCDD